MANPNFKLPGDFQAGKRYWMKGETLLAWQKTLRADRIIAGSRLQEFATNEGRILSVIDAPPKWPFQVRNVSDDDGPKVSVDYGTIHSPYGWSGPPTGIDEDLDTPYTGFVYLLISLDITTAETPSISDIVLEYADSVPSPTGSEACIVIAAVEVEDGEITSIFQSVRSNLLHDLAFEGYSYPDFWRQKIGPLSPSM
jgi:hypothetical protein